MARDTKWAVREALDSGMISKISVEEDKEKKIISNERGLSVKIFIASLIVLAVAITIVALIIIYAHVVIYSLKMVIAYLFILIFPIYAVYNIFATAGSIRKGDYEFLSGEVITKTDKGYKIKGLEDLDLSYLAKFKPAEEPKAGDQVKMFRIKDELHMFE
ncbi:MAG: hypothetical protein IKH76_09170 [Clostridiales bacterium]|nr:hypothetical protein [Clostridiales bacterium]